MTKLEQIETKLRDNSVNVNNFAIDDKIKAMSHIVRGRKTVALNRGILCSKADETSVLAEELGHFETGALYVIDSTYNTCIARSNRLKYEATARHWAYKKYCTPDEIETAFKQEGIYGDYAVAEYCQVTVEFLHKAIEYHRSKGVVFSFDNDDCA